MTNLIVPGLLAAFLAFTISKAVAWRNAYTAAQKTGFPVFLSPVYMYDPWWLISMPALVPFLERLPEKWKNPWLPMSRRYNIWQLAHRPFHDVGADTFILSTPRGNLFWTCDPKICSQLEHFHPNSQVAVSQTKIFDVYGPTVASVEGDEWKRHRRVIMTGFTPSTNAAVWKEATAQTRALIAHWQKGENNTVTVMKTWTSKLALHVISAVFFHKHLTWSEPNRGDEHIPSGYGMKYEQAFFTVIRSLGVIFLTPRVLLGILPFQRIKEAHAAFLDWTKYMKELQGETMSQIDELAGRKDKSILESITLAGTTGSSQTGDKPLPKESILGNLFFVMLAGHETTGNTMAFALILLAVYPEYQRKIQEELDAQLRIRPREEWGPDQEYQKFQNGWIGAVLKETMRVYCVVQFVARNIVLPIDVVDSNGITHNIPGNSLCVMNFAAAFQNSKTWPQRKISTARREELHHSPAIDFDPSQWLGSGDVATAIEYKDEDVLRLFPFGQGPHHCPGRLFAQVEMTATIAAILVDHSLELVVDEDTKRSCGDDAQLAWEKVQDRAIRMLRDDIVANISIQLLKELPIRILKRS